MKKLFSYLPIFLGTGLLFLSCEKQNQANPVNGIQAASEQNDASAACLAVYYQLIVDPVSGISYMFKTSGSPTTGAPVLTPIIGSFGDNVIREAGTNIAITFVSGIALNPGSGTVSATTSPASNYPSRLLRYPIANPSIATHVPMVSTCGLSLNVSDIEYNNVNGRYYAINRGTVPADNRIVRINPGAPTNVICLASTIPVTRQMRGLTFGCNGQGYVMQMSGPNGRIWSFNPASGAVGAPSCPYTGVIAPGAPITSVPEMGLHFDCSCSGLYITGNFDPAAGPFLLTDGMPACIGAASYASLAGVIKPTVDFARP
ncbi:MAG: hypothetical protein ABI921_06335 [Panacibacter sp.]